tara:strand:+ start:1810 stop:2139 length:330 start_codon:yes stop_codon:yes gene_type:complete
MEIPINQNQNMKDKRKPIILNEYVWFWRCCICNENAVGRMKCSEFSFAITKPTYLDNNKNIQKLALCDVCVYYFKLGEFSNKKILVDDDQTEYELVGLESGQLRENVNF